MKKICLILLLSFSLYASASDNNTSKDVDFETLKHTVYLFSKSYIDKINTQENKDKAFELYLNMIDNISVLSDNAKNYIESIDTNESKAKAMQMYLKSLKKVNTLTAENLAKIYCSDEFIQEHKQECDFWSEVKQGAIK